MKNLCWLIGFTLCFFTNFAQVKVGEWTDHLNYTEAKSVVKAGNLVYCSNGSGLVKYNTDDNSIEKLTKINGLSDVGVKLLRYNPANKMVLVIYENSNIDFIKDDRVINFPDIFRKTITGSKSINEVYFDHTMAFLACSFGVIKLDLAKVEVKDTYFFGLTGSYINVQQVTSNDSCVMAATDSGVYVARNTKVLTNFSNWRKVTNLPKGPYNAIVKYNSKILVNYSERLKTNQSFKDTLFEFNGLSWQYFSQKNFPYEIKKLYDHSAINKLVTLDQFGATLLNPTNGNEASVTRYDENRYANIRDVFFEDHLPEYRLFYSADTRLGLMKSFGNYPEISQQIGINGPNTNLVNDLAVQDGNVFVASTYLGDIWSNQFNGPNMNYYTNGSWTSVHSSLTDTVGDLNCVAIDPNDKTHVAYGSWGKGVIELKKNVPVKVYNATNSSLTLANTTDVRIGGLAFDNNSNLWAVSSINNRFLNVMKKNGSWQNFDFTFILPAIPTAGKVMIDKNNQVWVQLARGTGLLVYKPTSAFLPANTNNAKILGTAAGIGALPSPDIYSMAEDLNGHIWIGTAKGVSIFYNPENIFTGTNWDSQQILIEQDGNVQILLEKELVTAIAIDGANRKWIGTETSGVYCLSADGQKEIYHFTVETSPLYSNIIRDIAIDGTTGDVFIGTEKGIQSFRTSVIKGFEKFSAVHAYPNPIKPGYGGSAYITGLIDETVLKITDVAGNLVWETKSEGGQVEWNLKTINGTKVSSGVYIIYCATSDGGQKSVTKLLVIN